MLLSLPPEVLALTFDHLVQCIGIRHSVHLRRVSHTFDQFILDAVYALPTFQSLEDNSPNRLTWDIKMSRSMVAGLIHAKLRNIPEERALTRDILHTVGFINTNLDDVEQKTYTDTLVHLAADGIPLYEVINGLTRVSNLPDHGTALLENALAAGLSLDQPSHVQALLNLGAKAQSRTKWFGDALQIAACHAATDRFFLILKKALTTDDLSKKRLTASRLVMALECAATEGRADIFGTDLWAYIEETYDHCLLHKVLEPAINAAALAYHDIVIIAIFALSSTHNRNFLDACDDMFWVEVLRLAASNGSESMVQLILNNTAVVDVKGSLNFPLEDACKTGRIRIVEMLLAKHTGHNLDWYAGALYWASRRAYYDILSLIVSILPQIEASSLAEALSGASVHGVSSMSAVIDVFEVAIDLGTLKKTATLVGQTFVQLIDSIVEANIFSSSDVDQDILEIPGNPPGGDIFEYGLSAEQRQIGRACREGSFLAVHKLVSQSCDEYGAEGNLFSGGFSASIRHQRPFILQYLCAKLLRVRFFGDMAISDVQSTAIFQILLDHGWRINDDDPNALMPPLG